MHYKQPINQSIRMSCKLRELNRVFSAIRALSQNVCGDPAHSIGSTPATLLSFRCETNFSTALTTSYNLLHFGSFTQGCYPKLTNKARKIQIFTKKKSYKNVIFKEKLQILDFSKYFFFNFSIRKNSFFFKFF